MMRIAIILLFLYNVLHAEIIEEKFRQFDGIDYREVITDAKHVSIYWKDKNNKAYSWFPFLENDLLGQGKDVLFLMNGAIFSDNEKPAGLYIENGVQLKSLNTRRGKGNFHLQPNGVFLINAQKQAKILTTKDYQDKYDGQEQQIRYAVQSGPILIKDGKINPILDAKSHSVYSRNAVCIDRVGRLHFWITDKNVEVNFYQFATAGIKIGCENALYLDGSISKMYLKGEGSLFHFSRFVTILAITKDKISKKIK